MLSSNGYIRWRITSCKVNLTVHEIIHDTHIVLFRVEDIFTINAFSGKTHILLPCEILYHSIVLVHVDFNIRQANSH